MYKFIVILMMAFPVIGEGQSMLLFAIEVNQQRAQLSTSLADYDAASDGDIVMITAAEYSNIENNLSSVTKLGNGDGTDLSTAGNETVNSNGPIPSGNYFLGFKMRNLGISDNTASKLRSSTTSISAGYGSYLDIPLLEGGGGGHKLNYGIVKNPTSTFGSDTWIALYVASGATVGQTVDSGVTAYNANGEAATLNLSTSNRRWNFEILYTDTKQWE